MRGFRPLLVILCTSMSMSSCTCYRETPEPPGSMQRRSGGFGALGTRTRKPVVEEHVKIEPVEPTQEPELPTPVAEVEIPEDFPADVPIFEGSKPIAVQNLAGNAHNVLFQVEAERGKVFQHYREKMQGEGWEVTQEYQARYQSFLSFKKGNKLAQMTISKNPKTGQEIVGIMYQEEQPLPFPEF